MNSLDLLEQIKALTERVAALESAAGSDIKSNAAQVAGRNPFVCEPPPEFDHLNEHRLAKLGGRTQTWWWVPQNRCWVLFGDASDHLPIDVYSRGWRYDRPVIADDDPAVDAKSDPAPKRFAIGDIVLANSPAFETVPTWHPAKITVVRSDGYDVQYFGRAGEFVRADDQVRAIVGAAT